MMRKIFGILFAASLIGTAASSYNGKLLDSEADTFTSKLCSGTSIKKEKVVKSLDFLTKEDVVDSKYSQKSFSDQVTTQVKDEKFSKFAEVCKGIFDEGDTTTKIAINLLLEKVAGKYSDFLKKTQQMKASLSQTQESTPSKDMLKFIEIFSTADKSIGQLSSD